MKKHFNDKTVHFYWKKLWYFITQNETFLTINHNKPQPQNCTIHW